MSPNHSSNNNEANTYMNSMLSLVELHTCIKVEHLALKIMGIVGNAFHPEVFKQALDRLVSNEAVATLVCIAPNHIPDMILFSKGTKFFLGKNSMSELYEEVSRRGLKVPDSLL